MLPNLAGLPVPGTGAPCTPAKPATPPPSQKQKDNQADQTQRDAVQNSESTWPMEQDRYYTTPDGGAPRGSRSFVLSQPLVDMLDYYNTDLIGTEGLLDALLRRKLDAALKTCTAEGETNATLAYLDVDAPPAVEGVTSEHRRDTAVISLGIQNFDVLIQYYKEAILGAGIINKLVSHVTGLDNIKHVHVCIPVRVFITCKKEGSERSLPLERDEIEFRRLNIEKSKHLAPFVVLVHEGDDPAMAKKRAGAVSDALVAFVLRKLNPIMELPNLPRKFERQPWRMLYDPAMLAKLDNDEAKLAAVDERFGLKTRAEISEDSGWVSEQFAKWLERF